MLREEGAECECCQEEEAGFPGWLATPTPGKVVCPAGVLVLALGVKALGPCVLLSELTVP